MAKRKVTGTSTSDSSDASSESFPESSPESSPKSLPAAKGKTRAVARASSEVVAPDDLLETKVAASDEPFAAEPYRPLGADTAVMGLPPVRIAARAADRLRAGHVWVYKSDVAAVESLAPGSLVQVCDARGKAMGVALASSSSQIALRMLTLAAGPNTPVASEPSTDAALLKLIRRRIAAACAYRRRLVTDSNACRLIFSEADGLPGLIVDRFNNVLSVQFLTQAMDRADIRAVVLAALLAEMGEEVEADGGQVSVFEREDGHIRELEELEPRASALLAGDAMASIFTMNRGLDDSGKGVSFHFRASDGQKTGAFLDQRANYAATARYAHGSALDVCTYQGGFALHLARVCDQVAAVDISRPALEVAEENEALNRSGGGKNSRPVEWIEGNAFDLLNEYASAGRTYDTIVLDPPAFAKSKKTLETAMRGYKELNLRALKMLKPGGVLVTCSCSFHVGENDFQAMLATAASDAYRRVRIVERRGAAQDHPVVLGVPETAYLKCFVCEIVE